MSRLMLEAGLRSRLFWILNVCTQFRLKYRIRDTDHPALQKGLRAAGGRHLRSGQNIHSWWLFHSGWQLYPAVTAESYKPRPADLEKDSRRAV